MRYAVLIATALLAHAAPVGARVPLTDEQRLAWFLPVARAQWPDSPCAGQEQITLHDDAELAALGTPTPSGVAHLNAPCTVGLASGLDDYYFCFDLTHELGHDAGLEHSPDPTSVMFFESHPGYAPCDQATAAMQAYYTPGGYLAVRPQQRYVPWIGYLAVRPQQIADDQPVGNPLHRRHPHRQRRR